MSLFDHHSHALIFQLRQEQLAKKARLRQRLAGELATDADIRKALSDASSSLSRRLRAPGRAARPAFDA